MFMKTSGVRSRAVIGGCSGTLGVAIAIGIPKINCVGAIQVASRFPDMVLADTHRRVLRAGAICNIVLGPSHAVIGGNSYARRAHGAARRIRDINRAVGRHFHVAVNAASALVGIKDRHARAECLAAVIAARALRFGNDVLRTIINGVLGPGSRIRSARGRSSRVRTAAEGLMIGSGERKRVR